MNQPESDFSEALSDALGDLQGNNIGGTIDEADLLERIGSTTVGHLVEASDLSGLDQTDAYLVLCDLLTTHLLRGVDQVLGCLVFQTEPDAAALAPALKAMNGDSGFTPILPLSSAQAVELVDAGGETETFTTNAVRLITIAADQPRPDPGHARTLLDELAGLIEVHLSAR